MFTELLTPVHIRLTELLGELSDDTFASLECENSEWVSVMVAIDSHVNQTHSTL